MKEIKLIFPSKPFKNNKLPYRKLNNICNKHSSKLMNEIRCQIITPLCYDTSHQYGETSYKCH